MGRSDMQGTPWHEEYLHSGKNSYNCYFCDKEYGDRCQLKKCNYYQKECVGKNRCDFYQSKNASSSTRSKASSKKSVETWYDYYTKKKDLSQIRYWERVNPKHLYEPLPPDFKVLVNTNKSLCKHLKDGKCGKQGFINKGLNCGKPKLCKYYESKMGG